MRLGEIPLEHRLPPCVEDQNLSVGFYRHLWSCRDAGFRPLIGVKATGWLQ